MSQSRHGFVIYENNDIRVVCSRIYYYDGTGIKEADQADLVLEEKFLDACGNVSWREKPIDRVENYQILVEALVSHFSPILDDVVGLKFQWKTE